MEGARLHLVQTLDKEEEPVLLGKLDVRNGLSGHVHVLRFGDLLTTHHDKRGDALPLHVQAVQKPKIDSALRHLDARYTSRQTQQRLTGSRRGEHNRNN